MILIDTCSLLDLLHASDYRTGTAELLSRLSARHQLAINEVVLVELAAGIPRSGELGRFLNETGIRLNRCPEAALINAGVLWRGYRARGGRRQQRILPDFIIAAHALTVRGLVTRDAFFRTVAGLTVFSPSAGF